MVTVGYSRLLSCYSRLQLFTNRLPCCYGGLHQVTECLQGVTAVYNRLPSGLQWVTIGYRVVTVGYRRLQQVTEWLQWGTAGYSKLPSGYSGLQQVTAG